MYIDYETILQDADYQALRETPRLRLQACLRYLADQPEKPRWGQSKAFLAGLARAAECGLENARKMWQAYNAGQGWRAFVDGRSLPSVTLATRGARSERFRAWAQKMAEANQLSTQRAIAMIHDAFRFGWGGREIPGFERWQPTGIGGALPPGVSATSLRKLIRKHELGNIRQGLKTNHAVLPMVLTTREGVRPGTVYEFDDVWHDNLVIVEGQKEPVRVLEFGALDVASGCRIHWGHCPRALKDDGSTRQGLTQKMFVLFLAYVLYEIGFAASGLTLVLEHATASLPKHIKTLLENSGLNIRIRESGIVGTVQAGMGGYTGAIGGNPRGKTHIEVSHAAVHKINAFLPGQTGKDRQHMQESTLGRIKEAKQLLRYVDMLNAMGRHDLAEAVQMPFLTMREFTEILTLNYTCWNARTDHKLEGWGARMEREYQLHPGAWGTRQFWAGQTGHELSSAYLAACAANPALVRLRRKSPQEVWEQERGAWRRIPMGLYIEMIRDESVCGHRLRVRHGQLEVQDKLICSDRMVYTADCYMPDKRKLPLVEGATYYCVLNPYDLHHLVILTEDGRMLGLCPRYTHVSVADEEAIHHLTGKVAAAKAYRLAEQKARWAGATAAAKATHERNMAIFEAAGITARTPRVPALTPARPKAAAVRGGLDVFEGLGELPGGAPEPPAAALPDSADTGFSLDDLL